jgi:competence protein ComEC
MPLLWLSLAFLCGILLAGPLDWPYGAWLGLAGLALLAGLGWRGFRRSRFGARLAAFVARQRLLQAPLPLWLLAVAFCLGAARWQAVQPSFTSESLVWYNDQEQLYVIKGLVTADPDRRDLYTNLEVAAEEIRTLDDLRFETVQGLLLAKVPPGDWRYGDRVYLQGYLRTPFASEEFSYQEYLARQDIYSVFNCGYSETKCIVRAGRSEGNPFFEVVYGLRQRALDVIYTLIPDPEAALLAGILLGIESGIPEDVQRAFVETGTAHIIAISGFNFAIVANLLFGLFGRLVGRWRGMLAAMVGMAVYAILAGANAAVIRAAIMGGLSVLAVQLGRRQQGLNSLVFVAALMAVFDPYVLWDVSFQLSFAATLGLMLYAAPLTAAFAGLASRWLSSETIRQLSKPVSEYFLLTLAAQLTTLPVILYHFQRLSLISLAANPLVLPAQPPAMILGGLAVLLGLIWLAVGQPVGWAAWPFLAYTIGVVESLADLPAASLSFGPVSLLGVIAFYLLLLGWTFAGKRLKDFLEARLGAGALPASPPLILFAGVSVLAVLVWRSVLTGPDNLLHMTLLDVSSEGRSGEAILIQTPAGRAILINGGPSPNRLSQALGRRLPFGERQLDYLVVAGAGDEQLGALPVVIERFPPANVLWSGPTSGSRSARDLRAFLAEVQIQAEFAAAGQALDLGEGARLEVLAVSERGMTLLLAWRKLRILLPVGMDFEAMELATKDQQLGPMTALLLADSGFAPLNPPEWIERWAPQVVLLSVAADDLQGRPEAEVMDALRGLTVLRTDRDGWIELSSDGERLWVEVERQQSAHER